MNKKVLVAAAAGFLILFGLSLPAEAHGFRIAVGVNFGYGSAYFAYGHPWYGPAYYPRPYAYYPPYAYAPYAPVTVIPAPYPAKIHRAYPPGPVRVGRPYGHYVPRRYVRGVLVPVHP